MNQKSKKVTYRWAYLLSYFLFQLSCQIQRLKEPLGQNQEVLGEFELTTRELPPPRIKLLKDDTIALYLFDFSSYPKLKNGVSVSFKYIFSREEPFYTFKENKNQANLSYVVVYANKIKSLKPVQFSYRITAIFAQKNNTRSSYQEYNFTMLVVDKYKTTNFNFENFQEGFTLRMRSNDTTVTFPMNSDDIIGNNMNVTFQQIDEKPSQIPRVSVNISPRVTIKNVSYYKRAINSNIIAALGTSLTSDVVIRQRTDNPLLFKLNFMSYDISGNKDIFESPIFTNLEFIRSMRINRYTHVITLNSETRRANLIIFLLKMSHKDPLPLTRLFYPDFKVVYHRVGRVMYDSSYAWRNFLEIWVFKLEKFKSAVKDGKKFWEQNVKIWAIFLPDQSIKFLGGFSLADLKAQLDAKFDQVKSYANITCTKIEIFSRHRGVLGCLLSPANSNKLDSPDQSLEVFINIEILMGKRGGFYIKVEDMMTSVNPQGQKVKSVCLVNFWHTEDSHTKQKHMIKPFAVVYHDEGNGYYMKSQAKEWVELIKDSEIDRGFDLKNTLCHSDSKTMILEFQKELKKKRKIKKELKERTWSKSVTYFIKLDSVYRGNDRIVTKVEKDVAFDKKTPSDLRPHLRQRDRALGLWNHWSN